MQVIITDCSGSVSEDQIEASAEAVFEIMEKIDIRHEIVVQATWIEIEGRNTSLGRFVESFRNFSPGCTIHLITDGCLLEEEVRFVDKIYVFENASNFLSDAIKYKVVKYVPVMESERPRGSYEPTPIIDNRSPELKELVETGLAMLSDPFKYEKHRDRMYELIPGLKKLEGEWKSFDERMKSWSKPKENDCDHGVFFDEEASKGLDEYQVRKRWPRLMGPCPKGCGFNGIGYASYAHYICGDW